MAAMFCFTFIRAKEVRTVTFQSNDGEDEYIAKCSANTGYGDANLTIEWKNKSSKFIKISAHREDDSYLLWKTNVWVKDKTSASVSFNGVNYSIIVVNVAPFLQLTRPTVVRTSEVLNHLLLPKKVQPVIEKKFEKLSRDMESLLQTGDYSDVVLTDGSQEIPAHKLMLSIRSPVFAKMFQHPMKENLENRITVKDVPIEVMRELLHFMYTGTVEISDSTMARHLYVAADKYGVLDLREVCSAMLKSVDLNNVLDTLLLADMYSDKVLKEAALSFISRNYSKLKGGQNWNSFMKENQTLAIEILSFVIDKKM